MMKEETCRLKTDRNRKWPNYNFVICTRCFYTYTPMK